MTDRILEIMNHYAGFQLLGDGQAEIQQLRYVSFESPAEQPPSSGRVVLVLVEPRILGSIAGATAADDLLGRLERFKGDLRAEGLHSRFIEAQVYAGTTHKDGAILLALRRFVREVWQSFPRLEGVILVGSFPEASLVRRWTWASPHPFGAPLNWTKAEPHLTIAPEPVSTRSEIVLADLNGNWESLYHRHIDIPALLAMPDAATNASGWRDGEVAKDCVFRSNEFMRGTISFNDCFYIDDANFTIELENPSSTPPQLRVRVRSATLNPEVAPDDRSSVNVIARPDICVSRINARNIAYDPDPTLVGDDGKGFLDAAGNPRTFTSAHPLVGANQTTMFTHPSPLLERRLYTRYFDRNHRYRVGAWSNQPFRPAVISGTTDFQAASYLSVLSAAATDFEPAVLVNQASPVDYVNFMATPAPLKYIIAHSSPWNSAYDGAYQASALEAAVGPKRYRWHYDSGTKTYTPSFADQGQAIDWFVHRSLFHNHTLEQKPACLVIHGGCDVNTVPGTNTEVYGDADYARWQNAEGLLFGTNAVALLSRAKTFNDAPWGMGEGLRTSTRANFGAAWRGYYNAQAADAALAKVVVQNKRAYFWSMNGDWTLRLRNKQGLGLLALQPKLVAAQIQPNQAWIEGWNLDSARDRIVGIGDFDGSGRAGLVVTSDWGMAIHAHDGKRWRQLVIAARDTWFGAWRWDARVNTGRDVVRATANFAGSGADELLVTSSWGLGVLRRAGATMHATRAYASGTRIGGWVYDASNNRIMTTADLDGDGHAEPVVFSPWGAGVLSMHANTHVAMHPNGERLGGWVLDISNNVIRAAGDFDGDGRDELLVTSPWGVGVLELVSGKLRSATLHPYGTDLGQGCVLGKSDAFVGCGNLRGRGRDELLLRRSDGLYLLTLDAGRLQVVGKIAQGARVGGWLFDAANNVIRTVAPLAGNGREQAVVTSPWGIGVLGFDGSGNPSCNDLHSYGSMLGDWHLQSTDVVLGAGNFLAAASRHELLLCNRRP